MRQIRDQIVGQANSPAPFDIVVEGQTPGDDPAGAAEVLRPWQEAGATWWIESLWDAPDLETVARRLRQGPPRDGAR